MDKKNAFKSNFGSIAAAAGSAIGLGNIWRFPYTLGENGGGVFLLIYLVVTIFIGIPLLMTEFSLGQKGGLDMIGSFKKISPGGKSWLIGLLGVTTTGIILPFYVLVSGWALAYLFFSIKNSFKGLPIAAIEAHFSSFVENGILPIVFMVLFVLGTAVIVISGVQKGIERYSKFLMPLLFLILLLLGMNSFRLPGLKAGLSFIFSPDFSKITIKTFLNALGQAFFSLSVGQGIMMTLGAYMRPEDDICKTSIYVAFADLAIALLAGIAIFPSVFSYGIEPSAGPNLVFIAIPKIFGQMIGGYFFSMLFFILLVIAALTSSISLMEVLIVCIVNQYNLKRSSVVISVSLATVCVSVLLAFSQTAHSSLFIGRESLFDFVDRVSSTYFLPITSLCIVLFVGWSLSYDSLKAFITHRGEGIFNYFGLYMFFIKFVFPLVILFVFFMGIGVL